MNRITNLISLKKLAFRSQVFRSKKKKIFSLNGIHTSLKKNLFFLVSE
jgi:hypothetical protein